MTVNISYFSHFNCTIQELKLIRSYIENRKNEKFQLHHTGIKTDEN